MEQAGAEVLDSYVDDQTAANLFERADAIVLPYLQATGSGVASLAIFYRKPVIATKTGSFATLITEGETGHLAQPDDSNDFAQAIVRFHETAKPGPYATAIAALGESMSFDAFARAMLDDLLRHQLGDSRLKPSAH